MSKEGRVKRWINAIVRFWKTERTFPPLAVGFLLFSLICFYVLSKASKLSYQKHYESFVVSLAASFLEDFVFFLLLGIITIYISNKDPSKDHIERRSKWLFNGSNFDAGALKHIIKRAAHLAIFSSESTITVTFEKVHDDQKTIKTHFYCRRKFTNLMSDAYPDGFEHPYQAVSDDFYEKEINGEILVVATGIGSDKRNWIKCPKVIPKGGIKESVRIEIEGDGENEFEQAFWVWYEIGASFFFCNKQYASQLTVLVVNESGRELRLKSLEDGKEVSLTNGQEVRYHYEELDEREVVPFQLIGVI